MYKQKRPLPTGKRSPQNQNIVITMISKSKRQRQPKTKRQRLSKLILLAPSVICDEDKGIVYLGCKASLLKGYIRTLETFYRCECLVNDTPQHLPNFEREIVIKGMQRESDSFAFGLDYLVDSETDKHEYWSIDTNAIPC